MTAWNAKKMIWSCLSAIWNRQFLVFLFFLLLSATFWTLEVLNETTEQEFEVSIQVKNVPTGVSIIDGEIPDKARIKLRDKGVMLLNYKYGKGLPPIVIDLQKFTPIQGSAHVLIKGNELSAQLANSLDPNTQVVAVNPDSIAFYYGYGLSKRVPVILSGKLQTDNGYEITGTQLSPDSVTVKASNEILDRITAAYVKPNYLKNITEATTLTLNVTPVRGASFSPKTVSLQVFVDKLVEKKIKVPIHTIGFPPHKELLPIPQEVEVAFYATRTQVKSISAKDFEVVVNHNDLPVDGSTRCPLRLMKSPEGVSRVRIIPGEVEYVIEEIKH